MSLQALFRYPGLQQVIRWSYTLSHGISPGVCLVEIVPQGVAPDWNGTLRIEFGSTRLQFPDMLVDQAQVRRGPGGMVVGLTLLDRRWKWKYGAISGRYNLRTPSGRLDTRTERSPQGLATLLLQAMGETGFSVGELPNASRPEIDWVAANPAGELAALCEALGCRVVLGLDNRVALRRAGEGAALPRTGTHRTVTFGIDPPDRPGRVQVVTGPTRFQTKFRLEAVGEDRDGTVRPLANLAYQPADGWSFEPYCGFPNVTDPGDRARAVRSVYRWYRILCTAPDETAGTFRLPGEHGPVEALWQILPLEQGLIDTEPGRDGIERPRPPVVEGTFWTGAPDGENTPPTRPYDGPLTIDAARGIVRFTQPIVKRRASDDAILPADLFLTIAHPLHELASRRELRLTRERVLSGGSSAGALVLRRDDLAQTQVTSYSPNHSPISVVTNRTEIEREADGTIDAALQELQGVESSMAEYAGVNSVSPDGAIQQVAWSGGPRGALTRVGRNSEFSAILPGWKERRRIETTRQSQEEQRRALRAQSRWLRNER
ncbi:MAG: hypothetical protein ACKV0T_27575 [Planctomycetales bacterium]